MPAWTDLVATGGRLDLYGALTAAAPTDDDIPGLRLHASPVGGTLSAATDRHDVYRVRLKAGQTLQARVTAAAANNVDLYLFSPAATTVTDHAKALARATTAGTSDDLVYEVESGATGTYYLAAYAAGGAGAYTITFATKSDADIPGVLLTPSPVTGALTSPGDVHDVYAIGLLSGQVLQTGISGPAGTDFDLALYAPWETSLAAATPIVTGSSGAIPTDSPGRRPNPAPTTWMRTLTAAPAPTSCSMR